jgi:5-methylthioadenosine/S-adenosylhomocysteine deaminase
MRRTVNILIVAVIASALTTASPAFTARLTAQAVRPESGPWNAAHGLLIEGVTVVTMDDRHTVIPHGSVLVRAGRIVAVWSGPRPPAGVAIGDASVVHAGPQDLLYPGLINLHSHPDDNVLPTWLPPSSHAIPQQGKAGTDPYANRSQWGGSSATSPPELQRLVANPRGVLEDDLGLGLHGEVVKYGEVVGMLGGETAIQGASPDPRSDGILIRNIDNGAFDTRIAPPRIGSIGDFGGTDLTNLLAGLRDGRYDAWMVHLAEGVRDGDRRPGDPVSSRAEFSTLKAKGLLTDATVIIHGTALQRSDFAEMRAAPSIRTDGVGDGRGAKLVWSPLSNLLLYGETTNVYDAIAEGVLVSLGTDWTPSGSSTLLHELKIADIALRDPRLLGASRDEVAAFATDGKPDASQRVADEALDRSLVDMVTRNPALTLHWYDKVGSIEAGKIADLVLIHRPQTLPTPGRPPSVYRDLINATERDVDLVLVGGEPLAGATAMMSALKPGDYEVVGSVAGRFQKAVDVTTTAPVPDGDETLAQITAKLQAGLTALGGDNPPPGGGPGPVTNTYSYLKANVAGGAAANLPDPVFRGLLAANVGVLPDGSLNLERIRLLPLFEADDDLLSRLLQGDVDPQTGLLRDPDPPYRLYPANLNQIGPLGNPFRDVPL